MPWNLGKRTIKEEARIEKNQFSLKAFKVFCMCSNMTEKAAKEMVGFLCPLKCWIIWKACNLVLEMHLKELSAINMNGGLVWFHFLTTRIKKIHCSSLLGKLLNWIMLSMSPWEEIKILAPYRVEKGTLKCLGHLHEGEEII